MVKILDRTTDMKLNYKKTALIGLAFMSISAFWQLYDSTVPKILESTFNMQETIIGVIMALDNVLAIFLLPVFGTLSDKTNTKLGKRMPYIIAGTSVAVITMIFLPYADKIKDLTLFCVLLLCVLLAMAVYRSPAVALMPDLTPKRHRSNANAIINLMGTLGGIITLATISLLKPSVSGSYQAVYVIIASVMAISVTVLAFVIREKKEAAKLKEIEPPEEETAQAVAELGEKKQKMDKKVLRSLIFLLLSVALWFFAYNAVTSTFSRYTAEVWGDTEDLYASYTMAGTVVATLAFFPIGLISSKIGRKKVIMFGILMLLLAFTVGFFVNEVSFIAYVIFGIVGIGWASINVNSYPMVVEMSRSSDIGKYTGYYYTFSMAAQILTPILSGFLIEHTALGYKVLFPYAAVFMILAFVTMIFVKHGDNIKSSKKNAVNE